MIRVCQEMSEELDGLEPIDGALSFVYSYIQAFTLHQVPAMSHAHKQGTGHDGDMIYVLEELMFW